ncbi:hypothetical protein BGZ60DRAFT_171439 [Tricladium varicosporioides]|nr:hypothetical protein BGZ60DRAFT_171439 [Hymenoscyphus varicosporioides]
MDSPRCRCSQTGGFATTTNCLQNIISVMYSSTQLYGLLTASDVCRCYKFPCWFVRQALAEASVVYHVTCLAPCWSSIHGNTPYGPSLPPTPYIPSYSPIAQQKQALIKENTTIRLRVQFPFVITSCVRRQYAMCNACRACTPSFKDKINYGPRSFSHTTDLSFVKKADMRRTIPSSLFNRQALWSTGDSCRETNPSCFIPPPSAHLLLIQECQI